MATKKELKDYFTTVAPITPKAEVTFRSGDSDVTESVTDKTFVATHVESSKLNDNLNKVIEDADQQAQDNAQTDLDDLEAEVDAEEMLDESAGVEVRLGNDKGDGATSPMTHVPNAQHEAPTTEQMSETALLIKLVSTLIDKIDDMQNFNPVIHVPAPVIHVTMPETKRTVTKAVERDENNWIKTVHEHHEEIPIGEPLIEVKKTKSIKQHINGNNKDKK